MQEEVRMWSMQQIFGSLMSLKIGWLKIQNNCGKPQLAVDNGELPLQPTAVSPCWSSYRAWLAAACPLQDCSWRRTTTTPWRLCDRGHGATAAGGWCHGLAVRCCWSSWPGLPCKSSVFLPQSFRAWSGAASVSFVASDFTRCFSNSTARQYKHLCH